MAFRVALLLSLLSAGVGLPVTAQAPTGRASAPVDPATLRRRIQRASAAPEGTEAEGALRQADAALDRERSARLQGEPDVARRALAIADAAVRLAERRIALARAQAALQLARRREEDAAQRVISARTAPATSIEDALEEASDHAAEEEE